MMFGAGGVSLDSIAGFSSSIFVSASIVDSGTCGNNLTWVIDDNGTLTISGSGEMNDWSEDYHSPWYENDNITEVIVCEGTESIGNYAFLRNHGIKTVSLPKGIKRIGNNSFQGCTGMYSINLPNSINSIGDTAFAACYSLDNVVLPDSITKIKAYTFWGCVKLKNLVIPDSISEIEKWAFPECSSLTNVIIPYGVSYIGYQTFWHCSCLKSVSIPSSVTWIQGEAFSNCKELDNVYIPNSVTEIEPSAFEKCENLKKITIPDSVTWIGSNCFRNCEKVGIYGYSGTVAEEYANDNNLRFVSLGTSIGSCDISISNSLYVYDSTAKKPSVTVKNGSTTLTSGMDYTVSYSDNTNAGTGKATITGAGKYTGSVTKTFTINAKSISGATVTLSQTSYIYDGNEKKPAVTVKDGSKTLTNGTDYTFSYSNNINVGTAKVTVTGKGNYSETTSKNFTITEASKTDISKCTVTLGTASYTYDGTAKKPTVTVKDGSATLTSGTDYTVSYSNNTNAGTGKATITGAGKYTGSVTKTFNIYNLKNSSLRNESSSKDINDSKTESSSQSEDGSNKEETSSKSDKYQSNSVDTSQYDDSGSIDNDTVLKGDVDGDGKINVTDIAMIAAHVKGIKALNRRSMQAADVDGNGKINVTDIAMIAAHIKGIKAIQTNKEKEPIIVQEIKSEGDSAKMMLSENFTNRKIVDEKSAIDAIADVSDVLGIDDAEKEFICINKSSIEGYDVYRLQQVYEGYEVFGHQVIVTVDPDDDPYSVISDYQNVKGLDLTPKLSADKVIEKVKDQKNDFGIDDEINITKLKDVIYIYDNKYTSLGYKLRIYGKNNKSIVDIIAIFDSKDGKLLYSSNFYSNESYYHNIKDGAKVVKDINLKGEDNKIKTLDISEYGNAYQLYDIEKNISMYKYTSSLAKHNTDDLKPSVRETIVWNKNINPDFGIAVSAFDNIQDTYYYYQKEFSYESSNGKKNKIEAYYNYPNYSDNAGATYDKENNTTYIVIGNSNSLTCGNYLDIIAHEYTHSVSKYKIDWSSKQGGAINEAYSDIMGEVVENYITGSNDWKIAGGNIRDIIYPEKSKEKGKHIISFSEYNSSLEEHNASTLISHTAYLMNKGYENERAGAIIDMETLGKLWFYSMDIMPSNCSFEDCKWAVKKTADILGLSNPQKYCINRAFGDTGIPYLNTKYFYSVTEDFTLQIQYAGEELLSENYDITIYNTEKESYPIEPDTDAVLHETVKDNKHSFHLDTGEYMVTIHDNVYENNDFTFGLIVSDAFKETITSHIFKSDQIVRTYWINSSVYKPENNIAEIVIENESIWLDSINLENVSQAAVTTAINAWFEDVDFDGTLEFVVGPTQIVDGMSRSYYYDIYKFTDNNMVKMGASNTTYSNGKASLTVTPSVYANSSNTHLDLIKDKNGKYHYIYNEESEHDTFPIYEVDFGGDTVKLSELYNRPYNSSWKLENKISGKTVTLDEMTAAVNADIANNKACEIIVQNIPLTNTSGEIKENCYSKLSYDGKMQALIDSYIAYSIKDTSDTPKYLTSLLSILKKSNDEELYRDVLDFYYDGLKNSWMDYDNNESKYQICPLFWQSKSKDKYSLSDIGYAFIDLDNDGINELLIAPSIYSNDVNNYGYDKSVIYDLYTFVNSDVVHVFSFGERFRFYLCDKNLINYQGSSSAFDNENILYSLNKGELTKVDLSENEYERLLKAHKEYDVKLFSDYESNESIKTEKSNDNNESIIVRLPLLDNLNGSYKLSVYDKSLQIRNELRFNGEDLTTSIDVSIQGNGQETLDFWIKNVDTERLLKYASFNVDFNNKTASLLGEYYKDDLIATDIDVMTSKQVSDAMNIYLQKNWDGEYHFSVNDSFDINDYDEYFSGDIRWDGANQGNSITFNTYKAYKSTGLIEILNQNKSIIDSFKAGDSLEYKSDVKL